MKWLWWIKSRKVQVAFVTLIAAIAGEYGLSLSPEILLSIVATGVGLIGGIAIEDAGAKASGK